MSRWTKAVATLALAFTVVGVMLASAATPSVAAVQPGSAAPTARNGVVPTWWTEAGALAASGAVTGAVAGAYTGAGSLSWSLPGTIAGAAAGAAAGVGAVGGFLGYAAYSGWHYVFGNSVPGSVAQKIPMVVFDH